MRRRKNRGRSRDCRRDGREREKEREREEQEEGTGGTKVEWINCSQSLTHSVSQKKERDRQRHRLSVFNKKMKDNEAAQLPKNVSPLSKVLLSTYVEVFSLFNSFHKLSYLGTWVFLLFLLCFSQ